jgi:signal transduction histidine kinase/ActR/RegA family two-component response regulator
MLAGFLGYFDSENFMPHGHCFLWMPKILWLHVASDILIASAYYSIPAALFYFVKQRQDIPFRNLFYLFCAFILLCGTTHLLAIWVIWRPDYAVEGVVKAATAVASIVTAVISWKIIPKALELKGPKELQAVNDELRCAYENIEHTVAIRTSEVSSVNERLQKSETELQMALTIAQEASTAKSDFLATMSHEIRTPMNAVMGLAHILALSSPLTVKQKECIQTLKMSADSLLALINDLLDIAKIESQSIELELIPFAVPELIAEVVRIIDVSAKAKGLLIESTVGWQGIDERLFIGDPARLRQILLNICSNAVKFTEKGKVTIAVSSEPATEKDVQNLIFKISDTGIGIPENMIETVFTKFVQADSSISRKYGGTGLGLAITKELVEFMGGTITVVSEVGQGSQFSISIPLSHTARSVAKVNPDSAMSQAVNTYDSRVLLVEDNAANALVATTFLDQFGYAYDVAPNAAAALACLEDGKKYSAILMDVQMPGMDGYEATQQIRIREEKMHGPRTPIIGMTANAMSGDRERCLGMGMDDYIAKPFDPLKLAEKLRNAVSHSN